MRVALVLALLLAGCGIVDPYARSHAPSADGPSVRSGVGAVFKDAKLAGTPLVSPIYEANLVSRGDWLMCLRGSASPKSDTYTLYFVGYNLVATQRSVLVDRCDDQTYAPYNLTPQIAGPTQAGPTQIQAPQAGAVQATPVRATGSPSRLGEPLLLTPR
jgi:hypothetical protein